MYQYSIIQWMFFFYFYCFFGWCFESCYVSVKKRKLVNRGFMRGPFLPLYGSGAIMMLVVSMPFQENLVCVYLAGCVGATVLEYVTGVVMEALFKVRYWDYSNLKFNFQGHICLGSSLAWGALTIFMTGFLHKPVEVFVLGIPETVLTAATIVLTVLIVGDFALSFRAALDLKDLLVKLEKAREELERMQKRLDVILAFAENDYAAKKQEQKHRQAGHTDEIRARIEAQLETLKTLLQSKPGSFTEGIREEIVELRTRFRMNLENSSRLTGIRDFYKRNMIRSNPGMSSLRFKETLEELKETVGKKRKRQQEETKQKEEASDKTD